MWVGLERARRALGWIPFNASAIRDQSEPLRYGKLKRVVWDRDGLSGNELETGSLSEDARVWW